ncbi:MAG: hypothetical protein ABFC84_13600, partial [Veillonellales bacterium]
MFEQLYQRISIRGVRKFGDGDMAGDIGKETADRRTKRRLDQLSDSTRIHSLKNLDEHITRTIQTTAENPR